MGCQRSQQSCSVISEDQTQTDTVGETYMAQSRSLEKKMWKFLTVTILIYFIQPDPRNKYFAHFEKALIKGEINWF